MKRRGERVSTWRKNQSKIFFKSFLQCNDLCVHSNPLQTKAGNASEWHAAKAWWSSLERATSFWEILTTAMKKKTNPILCVVTGKAFVSFYGFGIKTLGGILWDTYWFYAEMNKKVPKSEGFLHFNQGWESLTIVTSTPHKNSWQSSYRQDCFVFYG